MRFAESSGDNLLLLSPELSAKDRKSTRLNSSHSQISYAVFCLKKKKKTVHTHMHATPVRVHSCQRIRAPVVPTPGSLVANPDVHWVTGRVLTHPEGSARTGHAS